MKEEEEEEWRVAEAYRKANLASWQLVPQQVCSKLIGEPNQETTSLREQEKKKKEIEKGYVINEATRSAY
jgi:hypothetical protein